MMSEQIGHSPLVMKEKYTKFNLRKLKDNSQSPERRINVRLTTPSEDKYSTTILNAI